MSTPPQPPLHQQPLRNAVTIKVGLLGNECVGKTSLMVKYVNNEFAPAYQKTLGVNFMERIIEAESTDIKFSIYDLGGAKEFENMVSLVTDDAVSLVLTFNLMDLDSLKGLKDWYRKAKVLNQTATVILVGTKYDRFIDSASEHQRKVHHESIEFARSVSAPLVFTSPSDSINVQKVFKILISKAFDLPLTIKQIKNVGEPLLIYDFN